MYFTAYALGGAAYIVSRFRIGSYPSVPDVTIEQRVDNGIALFGGLGANLALSKKVAFYFEASYMRRSLQTVVPKFNTLRVGWMRPAATAASKTLPRHSIQCSTQPVSESGL